MVGLRQKTAPAIAIELLIMFVFVYSLLIIYKPNIEAPPLKITDTKDYPFSCKKDEFQNLYFVKFYKSKD